MGCLSSKLMSRSMSYHEELNQSMQRYSGSIHALEEIAISRDTNDKVLATTIANKLIKSVTPSNNMSVSNLEQGGEDPHIEAAASALLLPPQISESRVKRSKRSCESLPEEELAAFTPESSRRGRTRSFHTVEEYDAMVEKIRLSLRQQMGCHGKDDSSTSTTKSPTFAADYAEDASGIEEKQQLHTKIEALVEKNSMADETSILTNSAAATNEGSSNEMDFDRGGEILERGFKRKCMARCLESLEIPYSIEFPAVASLKEWLNNGGGGANVTPKFARHYPLLNCETENKSNMNEGAAFSPELVAGFEEQMQQLEADAEVILKQIAENLSESALQTQSED